MDLENQMDAHKKKRLSKTMHGPQRHAWLCGPTISMRQSPTHGWSGRNKRLKVAQRQSIHQIFTELRRLGGNSRDFCEPKTRPVVVSIEISLIWLLIRSLIYATDFNLDQKCRRIDSIFLGGDSLLLKRQEIHERSLFLPSGDFNCNSRAAFKPID